MREFFKTYKKQISVGLLVAVIAVLLTPSVLSAPYHSRKLWAFSQENLELAEENPQQTEETQKADSQGTVPPAPVEGSMALSSLLETSLSEISGNATVPAEENSTLRWQITATNNTTAEQSKLAFYAPLPAVSLVSVASSGTVYYYNGTSPAPLSSAGQISPTTDPNWSSAPSGATAMYVDFSGGLASGGSISAEVSLSLPDTLVQKASLQFALVSSPTETQEKQTTISGTQTYTTNAYHIDYKPATGDTEGLMYPSSALGIFDATGIKNILLPALPGTDFTAWNTQSDGKGTSYLPESTLTLAADGSVKRVTLYALKAPTTYPVEFWSSGALVKSDLLEAGSMLLPPAVTQTGYQLKGWSIREDQVELWDIHTQTMPAEALKLFAVWEKEEAKEHAVTFLPNGGSVTPESKTYLEGSLLTAPTANRAYYNLMGWKTSEGTLWNFAKDTMPNKDITLTAQWEFITASKLAVTFDAGKGSTDPAAQKIELGKTIKKPDNPRKANHTFLGWRRGRDTTDWNFDTVLKEEHFVEPFLLTARWIPNSEREVTVYFHARGGSPTPEAQKVMPGETILEPLGVYQSGYRLMGWYRNPEYNRVRWNFDTDVVPEDNESFHLYAIWSRDSTTTGSGTSTGRTRPDQGPTIPGRKSRDVITLELSPNRPVELIDESKLPGATSDGDKGSVHITGKPSATAKPDDVNPETGGANLGDPKQSDIAAKTKPKGQTKQSPMETIKEHLLQATTQEMGMYLISLLMVLASVLLLIVGIVRRSRRRKR